MGAHEDYIEKLKEREQLRKKVLTKNYKDVVPEKVSKGGNKRG